MAGEGVLLSESARAKFLVFTQASSQIYVNQVSNDAESLTTC